MDGDEDLIVIEFFFTLACYAMGECEVEFAFPACGVATALGEVVE